MKPRLWLLSPLLALLVLPACGVEADPTDAGEDDIDLTARTDDTEDGEDYTPAAETKGDQVRIAGGPLDFGAACSEGDRLTIAAVGDLLIHGALQRQGLAESDGFESLWRGVAPLLRQADVTYANLEGPTAAGVDKRGRDVTDPGKRFDDNVYSSYPMFNYHPSLLDALLSSGVDVVSTSNNHSLDRWSLGADRTIEALEAAGLPFTGTRTVAERGPKGDHAWHTTTTANGFTLAWIACTYGTNGIPDRQAQVLHCYEDQSVLLDEVRALAARSDLDAVFVTPHWGTEYRAQPNRREVDLARRLADAGALAVIGAHPHVLQPWERHVTPDGRETFIIYSLGNFVSGQRQLARRSTLLLYLGLTRGADGVVRLNGARYVPLHMTRRADGFRTLEVIDETGQNLDSRALTSSMFGNRDILGVGEALVTDAWCDPDWTPAPHPHDGWVGGACAGDDACADAFCVAELPGGLCTLSCEVTCPDKAGRATTFCADLGREDGGVCVPRCQVDGECRAGYACREVERKGQAGYVRKACVPL